MIRSTLLSLLALLLCAAPSYSQVKTDQPAQAAAQTAVPDAGNFFQRLAAAYETAWHPPA